MSADLVTVARYSTPTEAHLARIQLEAAGIPVALSDENTVGTLWYAGLALGGVKLLVRREDEPAARAVLQSGQPESNIEADVNSVDGAVTGVWSCPRCGSSVDRGFDVCWSCGTAQDGTLDPGFRAEAPEASASNGEDSAEAAAARHPDPDFAENRPLEYDDDIPDARLNPYYAGTAVDDSPSLRPVRRRDPGAFDEQVVRAWRAGLIGLCLCAPFFFPPLLNLYSLWLILTVDARAADPSPGLKWRYWGTFAIDVAALVIFPLSLASLLWDEYWFFSIW